MSSLLTRCISRNVFRFLFYNIYKNPIIYHKCILNFLMTYHKDLYKYYKKESDIIKLKNIILNLQSYIDLFYIEDIQLIANELELINSYPVSVYSSIRSIPKHVVLTVRLLCACMESHQIEFISTAPIQRMRNILIIIHTKLDSDKYIHPDKKSLYLPYFPSNPLDIYLS